jgi:3-oxoacyl-[acyl-carrier protein] reductase
MDSSYADILLNGRIALVTGASRGIGRAISILLAQRGASVAVHYNSSAEAAQEVVAQITQADGKAVALQADMGDPQAISHLFVQAGSQLGPIDILVNNAGEMTDGAVVDMSDEMWEQSIRVNLTSVFRCSRAVIPGMKARGWGRIINMASQAAYTGSSYHAHYAAAKAGILGFTFSLAKEVATNGITVNAISPGRITTEMVLSRMEGREEEWLKQTPVRRFGKPEEVASVVAFLASEGAAYITGTDINVSGGQLMG